MSAHRHPHLIPLGDAALLVRFADRLDDQANRDAISLTRHLEREMPAGVVEIASSLISVLLRYDPSVTDFAGVSSAVRLVVSGRALDEPSEGRTWDIDVRFGGADGPDLEEVAETLGFDPAGFIARHNAQPLRVLTTGFAPGFVYCGMHGEDMQVPRRRDVRPRVPAGSVLFAAGQTAITATTIPTGWNVIGRTDFINFDPALDPPTRLRAGDLGRFSMIEA